MSYMRKQFSKRRQLDFCPACGARLVPTPHEIKEIRILAGLSQRNVADLLDVKASHVAYLERGQRKPSGPLILRYRKLGKRLLAKIETQARSSLKRAGDRQKQIS